MSSASAYYYNNTHAGTSGGSLPLSSFTSAAPLLYDNAVGDTATGYTSPPLPGNGYSLWALIDLGASPPPVSKFEMTFSFGGGGGGFGSELFGSNDGTTWTNVEGFSGPSSPFTATFTAATYRYWQVAAGGGGAPGSTATLYDFRLYDGSGTIIGPPGAAPPSTGSALSYVM